MKTILIGLIKHYKPTNIYPCAIEYEVDCFGEKEKITVNWEIKDPTKHEFKLVEPTRKVLSNYPILESSYNVSNILNENSRTCFSITYKDFNYNVPTTLEESDYLNLLITQLFANIQNDRLQILKSVIENEVQKKEKSETNE